MSEQRHVQDETVRRNDDEGREERKPADTGCDDNEREGDRSDPEVHVGARTQFPADKDTITDMDKIAAFIRNEIDDDEGCVTDIEVSRSELFWVLISLSVFGSEPLILIKGPPTRSALCVGLTKSFCLPGPELWAVPYDQRQPAPRHQTGRLRQWRASRRLWLFLPYVGRFGIAAPGGCGNLGTETGSGSCGRRLRS